MAYHEILRIVEDVTGNIETYFSDYKGQGFEFAGLCFHQGWNDQYGELDIKPRCFRLSIKALMDILYA